MEYIITERQFKSISEKLIVEQKGSKFKAIDYVIDKIFGNKLDDVEKTLSKKTTEGLPTNVKKTLDDLGQSFSVGTKSQAEFEKESMDLLTKSPEEFEKFSEEIMDYLFKNSRLKNINLEVENILKSKDLNSAKNEMKNLAKKLGMKSGELNDKIIDTYVNKKFANPEVKSRFDLTRTTFKTRPIRDFGKVKISDNLEMITKPRWKDYVAQVQNIKNPDQHMDLKIGNDDFGQFYYLSAKMENPIDAGRSFQELMKKIPKGARFGESASGSLSTDSFYNMLRRVKSFEPKVVGRIRLNKSGVKRFQEYIKNPVESNEYPPILRFKNFNDAKPLIDVLNSEIKKVGLNTSATISKNSDGLFEILIPNIQLIMK